jgi:hypothetical protein
MKAGSFLISTAHFRSVDSAKNLELRNFFDSKLREAFSHALTSFNCHNLGGVVRQLGVDRLAGLACQQIDPFMLSFNSNGQPASDAISRALGVIGTTQVVRDIASHIGHSHLGQCNRAFDEIVGAPPPSCRGPAGSSSYWRSARSQLNSARPIARKRDRPLAPGSPSRGSIARSFARMAS